jgi:hypothetical protein
MSRRGRLGFALLAAFITWSTSSNGPSRMTPVTVTLALTGATGC